MYSIELKSLESFNNGEICKFCLIHSSGAIYLSMDQIFRTGVLGQNYKIVMIVSIKAHIFVVIFSQVRALYPLNTN